MNDNIAPFEYGTVGADGGQLGLEAAKLSHLALKLRDAGYHEAAVSVVRRAASLAPTDGRVIGNFANIMITSHHPHLAKTLTERAMKIAPELRHILGHNLGLAKMYCGDLEGAYQELAKASERWVDASFDKACVLLLMGKWDKGWPAMEVRRTREKTQHPKFKTPEWDGHPFKGTLWVTCEQGMGDNFNFARYLTWARKQCDRLIYSTYPQLMPLFYGYPGVDEVWCWDTAVPEPKADYHVPLLSLPMFHGTTVDTVPLECLEWFRHTAATLKPNLAGHPEGKLKVGLCWAGSKLHPRDFERSIKLEKLLPLAENPDVAVYSFQVGPNAKDITRVGAEVLIKDFSSDLVGNWVATAAGLTQMDVLITVDTAVAHLAGCLGVPTCMLLCKIPDWRWLLKRTDTPWYPSMKLFRQHTLGNWDDVINKIGKQLDDLCTAKKAAEKSSAAA